MALIACRECAKVISSEAVSCPQCGCPLTVVKPGRNPVHTHEMNEEDEDEVTPKRASPTHTNRGSNQSHRQLKSPQKSASAQSDSSPDVIMRQPGILITHSLIELSGRSYSVAQLNSIKVDPTSHPSLPGLSILLVLNLMLAGFVLLGFFAMNFNSPASEFPYGKLFLTEAIILLPAVFLIRAINRLPLWALLRFEMSSGKTKALTDELQQVKAVASAIQQAMSKR